jgi:hypothetical protein
MTKDEALALDLALEALEPFSTPNWAGTGVDKANAAITAIRKARSAPLQEPVGEIGWGGSVNWHKTIPEFGTDLYTTPPAQPTPANLWLYWKVDDKSVITGPFKTHSKVEAYGLGCIDQTPLTVPAAQVLAVQEPVIQRVMSRLADLLDEDQFKEIEGMVVVAGCTPPTQPAAPVPLTDEQIDSAWLLNGGGLAANRYYDFARAIEAAHGITEKGD